MRTKVMVVAPQDAELPKGFSALEDIAELLPVRTAAETEAALQKAEVAYQWDFGNHTIRDHGPGNLKWIQTNSVGIDAVTSHRIINSDVVITNTRGVFEPPMAEYLLGMLCFFALDIRGTLEAQQASTWHKRPTEVLRNRRALILGAGGVSREIVKVLRALDISVNVVGRSARHDNILGKIHAIEEMHEMLPKVDDFILTLPLTDATRGLVGPEELALLPKGARVFNLGRGPVIDESALLASLQSGHLGGAGLDVFDHEPLPENHPFWTMNNVFVSPHMSSDAEGWENRSIADFKKNLQRWAAGEPLLNIVDKRTFAAV